MQRAGVLFAACNSSACSVHVLFYSFFFVCSVQEMTFLTCYLCSQGIFSFAVFSLCESDVPCVTSDIKAFSLKLKLLKHRHFLTSV